jgi:hypothetical protein
MLLDASWHVVLETPRTFSLTLRLASSPVLARAVRWVFADIVPDYLCGQNTAVLFLSLRWVREGPEAETHLAVLHLQRGDCGLQLAFALYMAPCGQL